MGPVLLFELEVVVPLEFAGRAEVGKLEEDSLEEDLVEDGVLVTDGVVEEVV
jgi:hypothetical protein